MNRPRKHSEHRNSLVSDFDLIEKFHLVGFSLAPEVIAFEPVTLATDMWSIGVITYIL